MTATLARPFRIVRSRDGTAIAYERAGVGPPLVLVGGAFNDRASAAPLALLAAAVPGARHVSLEGQTHAVDPDALARVLEAFFLGPVAPSGEAAASPSDPPPRSR